MNGGVDLRKIYDWSWRLDIGHPRPAACFPAAFPAISLCLHFDSGFKMHL
jgi:hypothetical protein